MEVHDLMRPVLMASGNPGAVPAGGGGTGGGTGGTGGGGTTSPTFTPAPGAYAADYEFTVTASQSVVWNWTKTGFLPTSTVPNGGSGTSITFSLTPGSFEKETTITLTQGTRTWTITLSAAATGPGA